MKKFFPHILAFVVFLLISVIYFSPQYGGKQLYQHDIMQYEGSSRDIDEHIELYGEDPQWEGRMFGGMPSYFIKMAYTGVVPTHMAHAAWRSIGEPASLILLAFVSFYFMLLLFGIDPWSALPASLAYGLSTYFFIIIGAGHITKMAALAFAPLAVGGVYYTLRHNILLGASLTALSAAMLISVNHPQIAYYFVLITGAMWVSELVRAVRLKIAGRFGVATASLALAALLAVGANSQLLWYSYDSSKDTIRAGSELAVQSDSEKSDSNLDLEYATAWSYGKYETLNTFIPNATGGSSSGGFESDGKVAQALTKYNARRMATSLPAYFGDQPMTSGPVYIGAVAIFLFVLGMFLLSGQWRWWLLAVSVVAVLLSWGKNLMWFTELFYNYFPMYGKFRTVSMILVIIEWTVPFAAALVLHKIVTSDISRKEFNKALLRSLYICGGVALAMTLFGTSLVDFSSSFDVQMPGDVAGAMRAERGEMLRSDSFRSLLLVIATAATLWFFVVGRLRKGWFVALLSLLVLVDMIPVNLRYLNHDNFVSVSKATVRPSDANKQILADPEIPAFRVLNLAVSPFNDATTSFFHRSVGGYHGAKLSRYQDIIEHHLSRMDMGVINMLNTKYIIARNEETGVVGAEINPFANGAAWFVDSVEFVNGAKQEIDALRHIDTKLEAVVDRRFELQATLLADDSEDSAETAGDKIEITDYKVNHLTYRYNSNRERIAVFSEIYYPKGWTAYVDGQPADYFRANYILRAMRLPAGEHIVEFKFKAPMFDMLGSISWASSLIILSMLALSLVYIIVRKRNGSREHEENQE